MSKKRRQPTTFCGIYVFLFASLIFLSACRSPEIAPVYSLSPADRVEKLLVFPFENMFNTYGANVSFTCPLCGNSYLIGEVADGAEDYLTERLMFNLKDRNFSALIPPYRAQGIKSSMLFNSERKFSELDLIVETGHQVDADAVLIGRVYRFRERVGGKFSVDLPASVTFDMILINVADRRLLWEGHFNETQKSLFENLFDFGTFWKRKGKWLTVRELADTGLEKVLQTFPAP